MLFMFICLNFLLSATLNKNGCFYHVKYPEVKIGYINVVGLFVAAPVAIETGLVFLSALQLEEEKKSTKYSWVCLAVCMQYCGMCV